MTEKEWQATIKGELLKFDDWQSISVRENKIIVKILNDFEDTIQILFTKMEDRTILKVGKLVRIVIDNRELSNSKRLISETIKNGLEMAI
ncbi:hypothetical protein [Ligilactobacillus equi]|uniref:Uncharacterized protein n=2 Tax=Ligilactobacillus equi TaxID=137357 RepID=V7HXD6_9LACO|nr:hypothetical protein [Ligilactobacillus equi]ETA74557.1 hypothetical protein LEQ_0422c [Ligilactobacillus equi DPC 6820]KRL84340.1 hypothetical protein FC36_GL000263 [Ligilactobacillus equi DSM 15833 = JCM 10991]